ncbi:MAG: TIR domain-containing protein, partial [Cyanobium sp.]
MASASGRRFTIAFSYAGEDRPQVAPLAEALAARLGRDRVLYDRFHEAEFTRIGLNVYLPRLYRDESELIVVVLSPDYPRKKWCGLEFRWIRELLDTPASERIMLLSLGQPGDFSELGILSGDSYLEISQRPVAEVVERICERLALQGVTLPQQLPPQPGVQQEVDMEPAPSRWRRWFSGPHRR